MGLLNYSKPQGESYLDYYKNYRGPKYNWEWAKQTTAPTETAAQAGLLSSVASPAVMDSGGEGFGSTNAGIDGKLGTTESEESVGSMGVNNGRGAVAAAMAMGLNAAIPGLGTVSTMSGLLGGPTSRSVSKSVVDAMYGSPDKYSGLDFGSLTEAAARAQMDAQALENDAQSGYGGWGSEGISGSIGAGMGANADGNGTGGGATGTGTGPGANGGEDGGASDGNGWRRGGPIKNRRGLLDHADDSMQNARPVRGLLDGPITNERDNIPAVNKTTGEKIAVESGEFVMTRKAVKKKGKKFFDEINRDAENDD